MESCQDTPFEVISNMLKLCYRGYQAQNINIIVLQKGNGGCSYAKRMKSTNESTESLSLYPVVFMV